MKDRIVARRLAVASLVGQGLFTLGWIVGGAVDGSYSHVRNDIASLGGKTADHPWLGVAAMVALALSIGVLAPALSRTLPTHARLASATFAVAGLATFGWAVLRVDCDFAATSCRDRYDDGLLSAEHTAHLWVGLAMTIALLCTTFVVARALWPRPAGAIALLCGLAGLALSVVVFFSWGHGANGLADRLSVLAMNVWLIGVAVGILYATRAEPRAPQPTPMRPRDFFGRDWTGTGTVTLRPFWLFGRRPQAFRFGRTATWLSDDAWTFEDRADFAGRWSERRIRFCRFESATHVSVVSSDLPDGAYVMFDEEGYRLMPYRMMLPLGPFTLPVWCRDESRIDGDGALVETIELSFAGVRVARVVMHARTVPPATAGITHEPVALPT